jgi:hypothetical protein
MNVTQTVWSEGAWRPAAPGAPGAGGGAAADLVLVFGSRDELAQRRCLDEVRRAYPAAIVFGCSTAGEIHGKSVTDDSVVVKAIAFEHTKIQAASAHVQVASGSFSAGAQLGASLAHEGLVHVFVLSDGLQVNGSELVSGLTSALPAGVSITGGLSGDGARFDSTLVVIDGVATAGAVGAVGLYGEAIRVGYASLGGWDPFGPERLITRAEGNVLYELDGQSALELYKSYLGEHAAELPASGLLYPLSLRTRDDDVPVVRTILAVDEEHQSMTFAGDMPMGAYARLMKANFDRLIDGAAGAAKTTHQTIGDANPELAILISCVGRKLVLRQRVEEEVESVREVLGAAATFAGFYSYGEISPFTPNAKCELHNQTMTITTLSERAA